MPNDPNQPVFPTAGEEKPPEAAVENRPEEPDEEEEGEEGSDEVEGDEDEQEEETETASAREGAGAQIHRIREEEDFPALVDRVFSERGSTATGASYAGHLRRFLTWCATKGIDTKTMPADTAVKYLEETYNNPVTRGQANVALRAAFDVGSQHGVQFARQEIPKPVRPPRVKKAPTEAATAPNGHGTEGAGAKPVKEGSLFDVPVSPPSDTPRVAQPVTESPRISQPRATPGIPRSRTGVQPLGQRIRISKRADGTEGVPPGSLILVGVYNASDLEGEGAVEEFIANRIRPLYGPKPGAPTPALYYVDRLDNMGQPIPNSTIQVPVMPPLTDPNAVPPPGTFGGQQPFPAAPILNQQSMPQGTLDSFLTYLMKKQDEAEKKYENLLAQMQTQAAKGGMDPTMFMLMAERMRPAPLDLGKAADEWKRANGGDVKWGRRKTDREPEPADDPFFPQGRAGGLAGTPTFPGRGSPADAAFAGFEAGHHERDSVIAEALRQNSEMMRTLIERVSSNAGNQQQSARDLFEMFSTFARAIQPAERPPDPVQQRLIEVALSKLTEHPPPSGGIKETIAALRELRDAGDLLGGEEKPLGLGDIVMAAVEHADQIGGALGQVLSSLPRAPKLPVPVPVRAGGVHGAPVNGATRPAKKPPQVPPMPTEAQQAFLALQTEQDQQAIVTHLFTILTSYAAVNADHWQRVTKSTVDAFKSATTRHEIAACVTNLYKFSGALRALNEATLARITDTLTEHYSLIYEQLTGGGQKGLGDSVQPLASPTTSTTAPSAEAQERGAAMARGDEPRNGEPVTATPGEAVYEDEEPTMTLPVGGVGNPSGAGNPPPLFG